MEVLLLQDIPNVGQKNDLLLVGDGYALNFLLPQNKALVATPTVRRRYAEKIRKRAEEREVEKKLQEGKAAAIEGLEVSFERKITKTGKLYAAISEKHIEEAFKDQHSIELPSDMIKIPEPIKALGEFKASVKISGKEQQFVVTVKEEK